MLIGRKSTCSSNTFQREIMASYLSTFVRIYEQHTSHSLQKFPPKAHEKYNGTVKAQFSAVVKDWEPFLLYVFIHNPLELLNVSKYDNVKTLSLCIPAFLKFKRAVEDAGAKGHDALKQAIRKSEGRAAGKVVQDDGLKARLEAYRRLAERERR